MTQLRKFRDAISNYFDDLERGIGPRGSTFTDVDAVSHDAPTKRFLFREFKHDGEDLSKAQVWTLRELATLPGCTVWFVRRRDDGWIGFAVFGSGQAEEAITVEEYRRRLAAWWTNEAIAPGDEHDDRWIVAQDLAARAVMVRK
jgi:hypothetical protein